MKKEIIADWLAEGSISISKLLLQNYTKLGMNEEEFMLILQVHAFIEGGNSFPTPRELSERMTFSEERCTDLLRKCIQRGFLRLEDNQDETMICESYSLKPLWEKLLFLLIDQNKLEEQKKQEENEASLYTIFEKEFGRPLSPMECETLTMWVDHDQYDYTLIKEALRESVISGKLNIRYIDRILFEWKKNNIKTIEQAKNYGKQFRKHQNNRPHNKQPQGERVSIPFYNWLES